MSHDLIWGKTNRDWSIGWVSLESKSRLVDDIRAGQEVGPLAKAVGVEMDRTFRSVVRLTSAKQLPAAVRRKFIPTLKSWQELKNARQGNFLASDYLALVNLREACRKYARELERYEPQVGPQVEPHVRPQVGSPPQVDSPPSAPSKLGEIVISAVGLFGLGYLLAYSPSKKNT